MFFSYIGFEDIANLAEEAERPRIHLPRAILLSFALTTVLYIAVGLAVLTLASPDDLAGSRSPLATAVRAASPTLARLLGGIALFATADTALITLIVTSRMLFGMARAEQLPRALARVLPSRKTPWIAALVTFAVSAVLLPLGNVNVVAGLSSFGTLLAFIAVNVSLLTLRRRDPDRSRPFRVPWDVGGLPVPTLLALVTAVILAAHFEPLVYLMGASAALIGFVLYRFVAYQGSTR